MNAEFGHALSEILIVLGTAMVALVVGSKLRIPAVVGLILTGIVIGPAGLRLVADREMVELFAEVGVVLLLFSIGLELSLERLGRARRAFLVAGPLQAALVGVVAWAASLALGLSARQGVFIAFLVILSSTAVVLKIYNERREIKAPHGELSLGILLFQDLLMVPMVVITPLLAGEIQSGGSELAMRLGGAVIAAAAAFLLARVLLPPVLQALAGSGAREAFLLGALFLGLGMAYLTGRLGLSPALGAFLGGVAAAESRYHHQLTADIGPFRDVFTSLFFISIGMMVVLPRTLTQSMVVVGVAVAIIVVKAGTTFVAIRWAGFAPRTAMTTGLGLAQLGEFSFLLLAIGLRHELLPQTVHETVLAAAVLTLLATPPAIHWAPWIAERLPSRGGTPKVDEQLSGHVVLVGYGLTSKILATVLAKGHLPYRVVDLSAHEVARARHDGHEALFGDAARQEILEAVGTARARILVSAISDVRAQARVIQLARQLNPKLRILTVAREASEIEEMARLGSDRVVAQEFESALEVLHEVLETLHVPRNVIRAQTRALRGEDYLILRTPRLSEGANQAILDALIQGTTEVARVSRDSPAIGQTLRGIDLRHRSGASVIAVVRGEESFSNPSPDLELREGDDLVLVGGHAQVDAALGFLRTSS